MAAIISKWFTLSAAHFLPYLPKVHPSSRLHGHSYQIKISIKGEPSSEFGSVLDYRTLASIVSPTIEMLDHQTLNDISGLENPTAETLCTWLWERLARKLPNLYCIRVNPTSGIECEHYGN